MFANIGKSVQYRFELEFDKVLSPILHLLIEISNVKDKLTDSVSFGMVCHEVFNVAEIYKDTKFYDDCSEDDFCAGLISYLQNDFIEQLNIKDIKGGQLLYKDSNFVIQESYANNGNTETFVKLIKEYELVVHVFSLVTDARLIKFLPQMQELAKQNLRHAVSYTNNQKSSALLLLKSWVDLTNLSPQPIDPASLQICDAWLKIINQNVTSFPMAYYKDDLLMGISYGEFIIPLEDMSKYMLSQYNTNYIWLRLKNNWAERNSNRSSYSQLIQDFRKSSKEVKFSRLLSYLEYNLYIKSDVVTVPNEYLCFFEPVYEIDKIKGIDDYLFYVNSLGEEGKDNTSLGVYSTKKIGDDYNLLCWISEDAERKHIIRRNERQIEHKKYNCVNVLRPSCSYYFITKYFEDRFLDIVKSCECDYIHDFNLKKTNTGNAFIQIDTLVKTNTSRLVFFEEKTCLNRYNIEGTIRKLEQFHEYITSEVSNLDMEYVIVAPYCNNTVEEAYKFFIDKKKASAKEREGLAHKVYDFRIPIAKFDNLSLRCIVEPEYEKLKRKVKSIVE